LPNFAETNLITIMGIFSILFGGGKAKLKNALEEGAQLIDVRTPQEFKSGSVKGAINIPLDSLSKNLTKVKGNLNVIVFCRSGARSGMAQRILNQNGIQAINGGAWTNVKNLVD
jgi:rhodanese-related sulfurtransferase